MKQIRVFEFGDHNNLKLNIIADYPKATHRYIRVAVRYAGVNPVDTYIRSGKYSRLPELPYVPGTDFSGIIDSIPSDLNAELKSRFYVGCRVFGILRPNRGAITREIQDFRGTYSEFCLVDPEHDIIDLIPGHIGFASAAAATTTYHTAYRSLFVKSRCKPGDTVLVHGGSGGVGTASLEMLSQLGAKSIATAGSDTGLKVCKAAGATHVINHSEPGYVEEIFEITKGEGVDIVIENLADQNLANDLRLVKQGGTIILVGCRGVSSINPRELMSREANVQGVMLSHATRDELLCGQAYINANLKLSVFKPILQSVPLGEASTAHAEIILPSSGGSAGRILLEVGGTDEARGSE